MKQPVGVGYFSSLCPKFASSLLLVRMEMSANSVVADFVILMLSSSYRCSAVVAFTWCELDLL